jgi:DNA polymerase-3 subunit epsilon
VTAIHHIPTPDVLTANVLELRLIQRLSPQYNRAGTSSDKYCYVRLTLSEDWPRLVVSKNPGTNRSDGDLYIGPLSSRTNARNMIEAIESVVPLRRCTVRLGRRYVPPTDAPVCSAAQLGVALCPCSGTADPDQYRSVVRFVVAALTQDPTPLFALLHERITGLAVAQRFEEAALVRDRTLALEAALVRQRRLDSLRAAGRVTIEVGPTERIRYEIDRGVLVRTSVAGEMLDSTDGSAAQDPRFAEHLRPRLPDDHRCPSDTDRPVDRLDVDELLCISRFIEEAAEATRLIECDGTWTCSVRSIPELTALMTQRAA